MTFEVLLLIIIIMMMMMMMMIIINEHWGGTGWCLSLPWEYGCSCPPESWVAPLVSARNSKATRVRVTTTSFDERMSNIKFHTNDVNGDGACSVM